MVLSIFYVHKIQFHHLFDSEAKCVALDPFVEILALRSVSSSCIKSQSVMPCLFSLCCPQSAIQNKNVSVDK